MESQVTLWIAFFRILSPVLKHLRDKLKGVGSYFKITVR